MSSEHHHIRRWESGALAHAVTDPFGQGPVPWLRGNVTYFDDTGQVVPWYVEPGPPEPPASDRGTRARVPA
ncbi:phosphoribosylamine--glycine ligase, partial [Streptomyces scabiei]|nr:phosphoribosylamine--glycine ligase [Streptomyces scabiei]